MSERILIKFKAQGDRKLEQSILRIAAAQSLIEGNAQQLAKGLDTLNVAFAKQRKATRLSESTFATLRNKMLLFSFAMSLGGRQLAQFAKQASQLQAMETAFTNLQGGTENASIAMDKLRSATDGTMSNFDLFQQANNAMVLGITKNSDEMAEMFDMAQRLGRSLGVDTRRSVESLVTGIGRQSRLMLDNIGIIVDSNKAYEKYAKELGKTASKLTDAEKKQAFLNATLESARKKVALLGKETLSPIDSINQLTAAFENFTARIGNVAIDVFQPLVNALAGFLDLLDESRIKSYGIAIGVLALAYAGVAVKTKLATIELQKFKIAMVKSGVGILALALAELVHQLGFFSEETEGATEQTNEYVKALEGVPNTIEALNAKQAEYTKQLKEISGGGILESAISLNKDYAKVLGEVGEKTEEGASFDEMRLNHLKNQIKKRVKINALQNDAKETLSKNLNLDEKSLEIKSALTIIEQKLLDLEMQKEAQSASLIPNLEKENAMLETKLKFMGDEQQMAIEMAVLRAEQQDLDFKEDDFRKALMRREQLKQEIKDTEQAYRDEKKAIDDAAKAHDNLMKTAVQGAIASGAAQQDAARAAGAAAAEFIASQLKKAIASFIADSFANFGIFGAVGAAAAGGIVGNVFARAQAGIDRTFHEGGEIQAFGRNRDNVPIVAQEGEFVMRRSAVESIGLENLNRMNRTGQVSGGANITFTGNVLSDSFIEEEAIPKIKDAIRRGADIGIS